MSLECNTCRNTLPNALFWRAKTARGYRRRCKNCEAVTRAAPEYKVYMALAQRKYRESKKSKDIEGHRARERCHNLKRYGITPEQYDSLYAAQHGVCAICQRPQIGGVSNRLHVDHDHESGAVRGLLCGGCNTGIGLFKNDALRLLSAINYLRRGVV